MADINFTPKEQEIFNLILRCATRDEVFQLANTTTKYFDTCLNGIYNKTDKYVKYRTLRGKFSELQGFLKQNPTFLTPFIPLAESGATLDDAVINAKIKRAIENVREELLMQADEIDMQLKALCRLESKLLDTADKNEQNKTGDAAEC